MPRKPRIHENGSIHHVGAHGVDTRPLYGDDDDRWRFLGLLGEVTRETTWRCLAFCLMETHYHLLVEERATPLSRSMHLLNSRYSRHFNKRYARRGHVFEGRYTDVRVQSDAQLFETVRYIAQNPSVFGVAPDAWRWSSYPALIGRTRPWSFVDAAHLLAYYAPARDVAIRHLRQVVEQVPGT
jgi:putative transposase